MITDVTTLVGEGDYDQTEITLRCRVVGSPEQDSKKTLYPIEDSMVEQSTPCFVSFWHEQPPEWASFDRTRDEVCDLVETAPLQQGEEILVRGIPQEGTKGWFLNVTSLLIRQPDLTIGKGEMRSSKECPRIYDLRFEKNVFSPGRYDFSKGALKGTIAHHTLEYAIEDDTYQTLFEDGWTERQVEQCVKDVLTERHQYELALCRLAWVSVNDIMEWATNSVTNLFLDEEFCERITEADVIEAERSLSESVGFRGRVDVTTDGIPLDLKTNRYMDSKKWHQHRFQLQVYLTSLLIESLDPGQAIDTAIEDIPPGVLVYPSVADKEDVEMSDVELDYSAVVNIMQLRNQAAQLREGFGIPTTYNRDCDNCTFRDADQLQGRDGRQLASSCKYHCQSERRWPCQQEVDGEATTQCPLYHDCDQRLEFRDPNITDHYSQIRSALQEERETRRDIQKFVDKLSDDVLQRAGLLVPKLELESVQDRRRLIYTAEETPPGFEPGATVTIKAENGITTSATYCGRRHGKLVFDFDGTPSGIFLDPSQTYQAVYDISAGEFPRRLLSFVDFAQRSGIDPQLMAMTNESASVDELTPQSIDKAAEALNQNKQLYIDLPIRQNRTDLMCDLISVVGSADLTQKNGEPIPDSEQRTLVLTAYPRLLEMFEQGTPDSLSTITLDESTPTQFQDDGDSHALYKALDESQMIISTAGFALSEQVFHSMHTGDEEKRVHSDRFFDTIIITEAHQLTEPEYFFLHDLADRVVTIGDVSRGGPELVSEAAKDANLGDSYFHRAYRQYTTLAADDVECFYVPGEANGFVKSLLSSVDAHLERVKGDVNFVAADGKEILPDETVVLSQHVSANGQPYDVRFELIETNDVFNIAADLDELGSLNVDDLRIDESYTIGDYRFQVRNKDIASDREEEHQLTVEVNISETPYLTQRLLANPEEAETVAEVCKEESPDVVLTPFASHADVIRSQLDEKDVDVPVQNLGEFQGDAHSHAVVSLAVANDEDRVTPPVNTGEVLYTLLTSARNITVIGNPETLSRNRLTAQLVEQGHTSDS